MQRRRSSREIAVVEYIGWYDAGCLQDSVGHIQSPEFGHKHHARLRSPGAMAGPNEPGPRGSRSTSLVHARECESQW